MYLKVHDLQTKLSSTRDAVQLLKDQLNQSEAERRLFEQQSSSYKAQIEDLRRQFDTTTQERDRSKTALESSNHERSNMEKIRIVSFEDFALHGRSVCV